MIENLVKVLAFTGILILISGISIKPICMPGGTRKPSLLYLFEKLASNRVIRVPLNFITRDKTLWSNKVALKLLDLSESGIRIQQFFLIKFLCSAVCLLFLLMTGYTNADYKARIIIASDKTDKTLMDEKEEYDDEKYRLYQTIASQIEQSEFKKADEEQKYEITEEKITEVLNTTDPQLILEYTRWFLDSWAGVQRINIIEPYHLGMIFLAFMSPETFLLLRWLLRGSVFKKEIIKLEYVFELLARIDGVKTMDIIAQLQKSSRIYSRYFAEFARIFAYDKKKGFTYLKNKNIKSLTKLAEILEIYCMSDKQIALQILEREVIERDESILMTADETVDMIDLVAFLSIIPLVYELVMLMLNPMLEVVYKAFEYV